MFGCVACGLTFDDNNFLIRHVELCHKFLNKFSCSENDCSKHYVLFESYKKHRLTKHASVVSSKNEQHTIIPEESLSNYVSNLFEAEPMLFINSQDSNNLQETISISSSSDEEDELFENEFEFNEASDVSSRNSSNQFTEKTRLFVASLYKYPDIARKRVDEIISEVSKLFEENTQIIKNEIQSFVKLSGRESLTITEINNIIDKFSAPFQYLNTEAKRFTHFKNCETFILPESVKLGEVKMIVQRQGEKVLKHKDIVAQFIPLRNVLKLFFELPGVLDRTLEYLNEVQQNSEIISNVVQCSLWKEKIKNSPGEIRIPLEGYSDDYETNNPLGSHKGVNKCGGFYLNIAILPPEIRLKVENIFLFMLFNSKHRVQFSNKIVFMKAIEELQFLQQEGIAVIVNGEKKQLYFDLILLLGDNLGLHSILGLVESFSANKLCRFCLIERKNLHTIFNERDCVLRNETNYDMLLSEKNVSISGIKEHCVFNKIDNFHVVKNLTVDIQHDFLEGILRYDIAVVLSHLIFVAKYLTLDEINLRLAGYQYGVDDNVNKPPPITEKHLKNGCIILSSAEMMNLFRSLFLIVGPLVPTGDAHWELFIKLKTVVEIVFSKVIHKNTHRLLQTEITEYLTSLSKLYPNHMKPKHHFILHYPQIMKAVGPLPQISSMRNESKHREGKVTSHVAICRKNVCYTIAIKHQLMLNYRFLAKDSEILAPFITGPIKLLNFEDLNDVENFGHLLQYSAGDKVQATSDQCYSYAVLNLRDITYNTPISVRNKLPDGYYITKHWM